MAGDLELRCRCGTVRGVVHDVSRRDANRVVCYCDDCQAFAHFLGRPDEILDAHGGSAIVQLSPASLEFTAGAGELRVMRLTPKGTCRWYTACCRSPVGNTLATPRLPFLGLLEASIDGGRDRDAIDLALGPVRGRVFGRFAKGDTTGLDNLYKGPPVALIFRLARLMLKWRLRGDQKRSPFFDAETGQLVAQPHVLSAEELAAVVNARDGVAS